MIVPEIAGALTHVLDPELGIDIVELGLVYAISCEGDVVRVAMTTTSRSCPMGPAILEDAVTLLEACFPRAAIEVEFADSPPWRPEMLGKDARRALGFPG